MSDSDKQNMQNIMALAAEGHAPSRSQITALATPMVQFQTDRFCRRFCHKQYRRTQCTLRPPMGGSIRKDLPLCDQANASYAWMLEDLTNNKRLTGIQANSQAQLLKYFKTLINSLPFYERWKNWRFGRRIHVPTYIARIDEQASAIFLQMNSGNTTPIIAQKLGLNETQVIGIAEKIVVELTQHQRLHLLQQAKTIAFSELSSNPDDDDNEATNFDIEDHALAPERLFEQQQIKAAWKKLDEIEQFVIEALVIEQQDANHVLTALNTMKISLKDKQSVQENNRQQLYYFKRKTLEKLANLLAGKN